MEHPRSKLDERWPEAPRTSSATARTGFDPAAINRGAFRYYRRLARVERYAEEHPDEALPVKEAARIAGLSCKYFSAFFHTKVGVRYRDWSAHCHVERAKGLMTRRNCSITEVAWRSGFNDLRTFERTFKKHTGQTPRAFKKSVRPC